MLAGDEQKTAAYCVADHVHALAGSQDRQIAGFDVRIAVFLPGNNVDRTVEYVQEGIVRQRQWFGQHATLAKRYVQVQGLCRHTGDGSGRTLGRLPGDDPDNCACVPFFRGDRRRREFLVTGCYPLLVRRQVHPQLKPPQQSVLLLRHLRMHDTAPGGHPLDTASLDDAGMTLIVLVAHASGEQIGDSLEAAVGMIGKAGDVIARLVGSELVEQQKGIQHVQFGRADYPRQRDAGPIGGGHTLERAHHRA